MALPQQEAVSDNFHCLFSQHTYFIRMGLQERFYCLGLSPSTPFQQQLYLDRNHFILLVAKPMVYKWNQKNNKTKGPPTNAPDPQTNLSSERNEFINTKNVQKKHKDSLQYNNPKVPSQIDAQEGQYLIKSKSEHVGLNESSIPCLHEKRISELKVSVSYSYLNKQTGSDSFRELYEAQRRPTFKYRIFICSWISAGSSRCFTARTRCSE